jgi:hypothetical protein
MRRSVRVVILLLAAGLLVLGGMEIGLEVVRHRLQDAEINLWRCGVGAALSALAVLLAAGSARLAQKLTDDFEE